MYYEARFWVEIIAALTVPISVLAVIWHRLKTETGIGVKAIQFLALGVLIPIILIMGLEKTLEASTIGTILGAMVGYLFANITGGSANN